MSKGAFNFAIFPKNKPKPDLNGFPGVKWADVAHDGHELAAGLVIFKLIVGLLQRIGTEQSLVLTYKPHSFLSSA